MRVASVSVQLSPEWTLCSTGAGGGVGGAMCADLDLDGTQSSSPAEGTHFSDAISHPHSVGWLGNREMISPY